MNIDGTLQQLRDMLQFLEAVNVREVGNTTITGDTNTHTVHMTLTDGRITSLNIVTREFQQQYAKDLSEAVLHELQNGHGDNLAGVYRDFAQDRFGIKPE